MRSIEREMLDAIREQRDWESSSPHGKTEVAVRTHNAGDPEGRHATVYLHGHPIATWFYDRQTLEVNEATLRRWPTVTTKSRLRALGADVEQKDNRVYLDGEDIGPGMTGLIGR